MEPSSADEWVLNWVPIGTVHGATLCGVSLECEVYLKNSAACVS